MSAALQAIKSRYDGDATLAAMPLWLDQAKDGAAYPYAILHDNGGPVKLAFGSGTFKMRRFTIRALSTSDTDLKSWQDALHTRFDRTGLTITGASGTCYCIRVDDYLRCTKGRDLENNAVYEATSIYRVEVETSA